MSNNEVAQNRVRKVRVLVCVLCLTVKPGRSLMAYLSLRFPVSTVTKLELVTILQIWIFKCSGSKVPFTCLFHAKEQAFFPPMGVSAAYHFSQTIQQFEAISLWVDFFSPLEYTCSDTWQLRPRVTDGEAKVTEIDFWKVHQLPSLSEKKAYFSNMCQSLPNMHDFMSLDLWVISEEREIWSLMQHPPCWNTG